MKPLNLIRVIPAEESVKQTIQISLNGQKKKFPSSDSLAHLIESLKINPKQIAVVLNEEVVLRSDLGRTFLRNGDRIDILRAVAGG